MDAFDTASHLLFSGTAEETITFIMAVGCDVAVLVAADLNRWVYYYALFILSVVTLSSFYLSWSANLGLGELSVERMTIEREPGRPVDFLVYRPRYSMYGGPLPAILTIPGLAGSKEGLYSFNMELARRNFTVVSVDLPGHGDSILPFNQTDFQEMAEDCYAALRYVQLNDSATDDTLYGVLTHSLGFEVGVLLSNFSVAPRGYASVGWAYESATPPGNLLLALGQYDELISVEDALETLRRGTGNDSAEAGITYGSFENQTAYRVSLAPTEHVFEAVDTTIVAATTEWLVESVQGESHTEQTLPFSSVVFTMETIATATGAFALLVSIIPLMISIRSKMPRLLTPRHEIANSSSLPVKKTIVTSIVLSVAMPLLFAGCSTLSFHLERAGIWWPSSMFATGLVIFFVAFPAVGVTLMWLMLGRESTRTVIASLGLSRGSRRVLSFDILGAVVASLIGIGWLLLLLGISLVASVEGVWVTISLVRFPVGARALHILQLLPAAVIFYLFDAAWIRGLLIANRAWNGHHAFVKSIILTAAARIVPFGITAVVIVFGITGLGFIQGSMVLMGLLLLLFFVVSTLTTLLFAWTSHEFQNVLPEVVVGAFILCWVAISSIPLI